MPTHLSITSSRFLRALTLLLLSALSLAGTSCGRTRASALPAIPMEKVMQAIRDYGRGHQSKPPASGDTLLFPQVPGPEDILSFDGPYQDHIGELIAQGDFAALEKEAQKVREDKSRLSGGIWKISAFYDGVSVPPGVSEASASDWAAHIATVKKWVAAYPESATARIALASTYDHFGSAARGGGYANTVTDEGWKLLAENTALAKSTLLDAARLKEKCPYWYEIMQSVALTEGWDKQQARELLDQAAAFEPTYHHYYRRYGIYLLPKWEGQEGETQAFAEEISKRLGSPQGDIAYFEIASLVACQCDKERDSLDGLSWPRVKHGYEELSRLYGMSYMKVNRFAYMCFVANDKKAAKHAFEVVGDDWHPSVWHSEDDFKSARAWAESK